MTRMPSTSRATQPSQLRVLLSSKGIRVTEQRLAVLTALASQTVPVTFPQLAEELEPKGLDRATVYRNLHHLSEAGILIRSQLADGVARYELPPRGTSLHTQHFHLVCVDCGSVTCLPANAVTLHGDAKRRVTEVQLRGHCASCAG